MDEENLDEQESLNTDEDDTSKNEDDQPEESNKEVEELQKKANLADNYKKRAEKAEIKLKKFENQPKEDLSSDDILALAKANLHDEDIAEVREWAKFKSIPVKEALNDPMMKSSIAQREIDRRNAEAANTKGRTGDSKRDAEVIRQRAEQGDLPESDEDIAKLADH